MDMFMAEMEGGSASLGTPGEHGKDIFFHRFPNKYEGIQFGYEIWESWSCPNWYIPF
jgi:hypothetical protein